VPRGRGVAAWTKSLRLAVWVLHPASQDIGEVPFLLSYETRIRRYFFMVNKKARIRLRVLIFSAIQCALSVVLGQYLSIKIGDSIRIGFGSLPVLLAGYLFGPWIGLLVGALSDIVGCAVYYGLGSMIPLVTVGMMAEGFLAGLFAKKKTPLKVVFSVALSRLVGTALLRSLGLYLRYQMPAELLLMRVICVVIEIVLMAILLTYLLCRNQTVQKVLKGWTAE